jgi:hypothetical protein
VPVLQAIYSTFILRLNLLIVSLRNLKIAAMDVVIYRLPVVHSNVMQQEYLVHYLIAGFRLHLKV